MGDHATPRFGVMTGSWPLGLPPHGGFFADLARQVENLGYDLLFTGDHLFTHSPITDAPALLAAYATVTQRVQLGTGVLLPALREPVVTAKQLATVDYLSGGRLIVGAGVGGEIEQEWRAQQVPLAERGARTDEALALFRAHWSGEPVEFHGRFRTVTGVQGNPLPARAGGPPVWIGGRADAALARAARHDGWLAYAATPRRVAAGRERIAELRSDGGSGSRTALLLFTYLHDDVAHARATASAVLGARYAQDFSSFLDAFCAVGDDSRLREVVDAYCAVGVQDVLLCPQCGWEEVPEQVARWASVLGLAEGAPT
jgi:alkanesulfonate monooxygenase SsuD/methylene tetrahydromethanopterin reductase-like flavin-dependent oxidoreductase (luciferase family)